MGNGLSFNLERVVGSIMDHGREFIARDSGKAGLVIFWILFFFHLIEGAAEAAERPSSCRLFKGRFWLRITIVTALLGGYQTIVVGPVAAIEPKYMTSFTLKWVDVWVSEMQAMDSMKKAEGENQDLKYNEV